jgi:hypothetical protein
MSVIQNEASVFLKPMVDGEAKDLDADAQRAVGAWAMMTALTWQFSFPNAPNHIPASMLDSF